MSNPTIQVTGLSKHYKVPIREAGLKAAAKSLFQSLYAAGRWPVTIYPNWLRIGLTFIVPVAFAVTVPAQALTGRLTPYTLLGALGVTVLLAILARVVWKLGVRSYSGASA